MNAIYVWNLEIKKENAIERGKQYHAEPKEAGVSPAGVCSTPVRAISGSHVHCGGIYIFLKIKK